MLGIHLGNMLYRRASVFFFSSMSSRVLSATWLSKLDAYFSMMAIMLSKMLGFLAKEL